MTLRRIILVPDLTCQDSWLWLVVNTRLAIVKVPEKYQNPRREYLGSAAEMGGERQKENGADGNHSAMRQANRFRALDIEFLTAQISRPAVPHLSEDVSHIGDSPHHAATRHRNNHGHDAAQDGGDHEDAEPIAPTHDRSDSGH